MYNNSNGFLLFVTVIGIDIVSSLPETLAFPSFRLNEVYIIFIPLIPAYTVRTDFLYTSLVTFIDLIMY
jgi:hypothetical protein